MICPKCNKNKIDLGFQVKEWDEEYGDEAIINEDFPTYINLKCKKCGMGVAGVFIEATPKEEIIKSPVGDVHFHKPK